MGNRAAHFAGRAFDIDMNPLMVAGGVGKRIDPMLVNHDPVRNANFLADQVSEVRIGHFTHGFIPLV